jgi:hypothetical protein
VRPGWLQLSTLAIQKKQTGGAVADHRDEICCRCSGKGHIMSPIVKHIIEGKRKARRQQAAQDALEFLGVIVIIACFVAFMYMGYGLGW